MLQKCLSPGVRFHSDNVIGGIYISLLYFTGVSIDIREKLEDRFVRFLITLTENDSLLFKFNYIISEFSFELRIEFYSKIISRKNFLPLLFTVLPLFHCSMILLTIPIYHGSCPIYNGPNRYINIDRKIFYYSIQQ